MNMSRKRRLGGILLMLAICLGAFWASAGKAQSATSTTSPAATEPSVTVQTLTVRNPDYAKLTAGFVDQRFGDSRAEPSLALTLHIHSPEKMLTTTVTIDKVVDDTGQTLQAQAPSAKSHLTWPSSRSVSEDLHESFVDLAFLQGPARGASELIVRGTAVLSVGRSSRTDKVPVALAQGAVLKAANTTFTLLSVTHYDSYGVTFTTTGVPSQIEHFTLTDGAGTLYADKPSRTMELGSEYRADFFLKELPAHATAEVTWFDKVEHVTLPFELKVSLALKGGQP
jgi:hypothetical protein